LGNLWQHLKCRSSRRWALSVEGTSRYDMHGFWGFAPLGHLQVFSSKEFEVYLIYPQFKFEFKHPIVQKMQYMQAHPKNWWNRWYGHP
jgi:hypothetical protein